MPALSTATEKFHFSKDSSTAIVSTPFLQLTGVSGDAERAAVCSLR
jgi:hypothetical protein